MDTCGAQFLTHGYPSVRTDKRQREGCRKSTCSYDYLPIHTKFLINDVLSIYSFSWVPSVFGNCFWWKKKPYCSVPQQSGSFSEYLVLLEVCTLWCGGIILFSRRCGQIFFHIFCSALIVYEFLD